MTKKEKLDLLYDLVKKIDEKSEEKKSELKGEEEIGYLEGLITTKEAISNMMWDIIEE